MCMVPKRSCLIRDREIVQERISRIEKLLQDHLHSWSLIGRVHANAMIALDAEKVSDRVYRPLTTLVLRIIVVSVNWLVARYVGTTHRARHPEKPSSFHEQWEGWNHPLDRFLGFSDCFYTPLELKIFCAPGRWNTGVKEPPVYSFTGPLESPPDEELNPNVKADGARMSSSPTASRLSDVRDDWC
jgi:hypothetical protein